MLQSILLSLDCIQWFCYTQKLKNLGKYIKAIDLIKVHERNEEPQENTVSANTMMILGED